MEELICILLKKCCRPMDHHYR